MPVFQRLSPEQIALFRSRRENQDNLEPYQEFLKGMKVGDWGTLAPDEGENRRVVKRRLTVAAKEIGLTVRYRQGGTEDDPVRFQVKVDPKATPEAAAARA